MMEFNELIENHEWLAERLKIFYTFNAGYAGQQDEIEYLTHRIIQPKYSYIECVNRSLPYLYRVEIDVHSVDGPHKGVQTTSWIDIPKQCKNGFLIINSEGAIKWRSPINICVIDQKIKYKSHYNVLEINRRSKIDGLPDVRINLEDLLISTEDQDGIMRNYDLISWLKMNGISEPDLKSVFGTSSQGIGIIDPTFTIDIPKSIQDDISNKILQLIKREPVYKSRLSPIDIVDLVKLVNTHWKTFEPFSPMDCHFKSQADMMFRDIEGNNKWNIIRDNADRFVRNQSLESERPNKFTRCIRSYFSMQAAMFNAIQVASDSNSGSFLSQTRKIYFVTEHLQRGRFHSTIKTTHEELKYTDDFVGVICPAKTPESVSQVNIKNELARCATIDDNKLYVTVRDKSGNLVKLSLVDYYKTRVLATTNWNYDENRLILNNDKTITVLQLGEYKRVSPDLNNFDYIQMDDSSIMSYNISMIPMANHCDHVRLSMASNMFDQAIPTTDSTPPVIFTGVEAQVFANSDMNFTSPVDGTIVDEFDKFIKIQQPNGETRIITIPDDYKSMNHAYIRYLKTKKIGDHIKKGEVILASNSFKDNELALTTQFRTAFMHYKFKEEEDGFIISESAAKKLTHVIDYDIDYQVPLGREFRFNYEDSMERYRKYDPLAKFDKRTNKFGLPEIGAVFNKGEIIGMISVEDDPETMKADLFKIADLENIGVKLFMVPGTAAKCTVVDVQIKVKSTKEVNSRSINFQECLDYYKKQAAIKNQRIKDFISNSVEDSLILDRSEDFDAEVIIKMRSENTAKLGDKISNRYGGKGTILAIYKDSEMPRVGGPKGEIIEVISSPLAPYNRKNLAQIIERDLMNFSHIAWVRDEEYIKNGDFDSVRNDLNKLNVTDRFNDYSNDDLIKLHNSFKNFYRIRISALDRKYDSKTMLSIAEYFGVNLDEGEKLYLPGRIDEIGYETFDRYTKNPVQVGYSELIRLHFLPEFKAKATSDDDYESDELVLGNGSVRSGGQRQGNMETWTFMAHDVLSDVDKITKTAIFDNAISDIQIQMAMVGLQLGVDNGSEG